MLNIEQQVQVRHPFFEQPCSINEGIFFIRFMCGFVFCAALKIFVVLINNNRILLIVLKFYFRIAVTHNKQNRKMKKECFL